MKSRKQGAFKARGRRWKGTEYSREQIGSGNLQQKIPGKNFEKNDSRKQRDTVRGRDQTIRIFIFIKKYSDGGISSTISRSQSLHSSNKKVNWNEVSPVIVHSINIVHFFSRAERNLITVYYFLEKAWAGFLRRTTDSRINIPIVVKRAMLQLPLLALCIKEDAMRTYIDSVMVDGRNQTAAVRK